MGTGLVILNPTNDYRIVIDGCFKMSESLRRCYGTAPKLLGLCFDDLVPFLEKSRDWLAISVSKLTLFFIDYLLMG